MVMFGLGFTEILVVLVLVLILFGAGKLPEVMGDLGKGLKSFKDEMDGKKMPAAKGQVSGKKPVKKTVTKKKPAKRKK